MMGEDDLTKSVGVTCVQFYSSEEKMITAESRPSPEWLDSSDAHWKHLVGIDRLDMFMLRSWFSKYIQYNSSLQLI